MCSTPLRLLCLAALMLVAGHTPTFSGAGQPPTLALIATYDTGLGAGGAEIISARGDRAVLANAGDGSVDILDTADLLAIRRVRRVKVPELAGLAAVAIHPSQDLFLAVAGASAPSRFGRLLVFRLSDGALLAQATVAPDAASPNGRQPDSVEIAPDGAFAAIAVEAEQTGADDGGAGALAVVDLRAFDPASPTPIAVQTVELPDISGIAGIGTGRAFPLPGRPAVTSQPATLEPEGIAFAADSRTVYATLQENNAVARLDLTGPLPATLPRANVFGLGQVNLLTDQTSDGTYAPVQQLTSFREPDGIRTIEIAGAPLLVTADEGDTAPAPRGGRTVSVFDAATGALVGDAGNQLADLAHRYGRYADSHSPGGGVEPEMLDVARFGGRVLAAVGLEQAGAVAFVDVSNPASPQPLGLVRTGANPEGVKLAARGELLYALTANEGDGTLTVATVPAQTLSVTLPYEPGTSRPFGLGVVDADSDELTIALELSPAPAGTLSRTVVAGAVAQVNAELSALTFTPAPGFDAVATVMVAVDDGANTATGTIALTPPLAAPAITAQPRSVTIAPGQQATLVVAATGSPPLRYQWYQGAAGDVSAPVEGATSATLTTPALQASASYWVRVSNAGGSADSSAAAVTVIAPPIQVRARVALPLVVR